MHGTSSDTPNHHLLGGRKQPECTDTLQRVSIIARGITSEVYTKTVVCIPEVQ